MKIAIYFFVGGILSTVIHLISKTGHFAIAGLLPLFPTFAIIAHTSVVNEVGYENIKPTIILGLFAIFPYACYLLSMLVLSEQLQFFAAVVLSLVIWFATSIFVLRVAY